MSWPSEGDSVVIIDLETRSPVDIRKRGAYIYATDKRTELLSGAAVRLWQREGFPPEIYLWTPLAMQLDWRRVLADARVVDLLHRCGLARAKIVTGTGIDAPDQLVDFANTNVPFIAHNGWAFDQHVARRFGLGSEVWIDTLPLARARGLPPGLEGLGRELLGLGKDAEGRKVMLRLCKPSGRTKRYVVPSVDDMEKLLRYDLLDVLILVYAWQRELGHHEPEPTYWLDAEINEYGVKVDLPLVDDLLWVAEEARARELRRLAYETNGRVDAALLRSPKKLRTWVAEQGIELANCQAATINEALAERDMPDHVRRTLLARVGENRVGAKKLAAFRSWADGHGVIRYTLAYHGTFTGRWAGRGPQPQNLPRPCGVDDELLARALDLPRGDPRAILQLCDDHGLDPTDLVSDLVRMCIIPDDGEQLLVMDFASIEGRVLAWCAGNEDALAAYRDGVDLYKVMAGRIFGVGYEDVTKEQRAVGKVAVLACGYQMGHGRFADTAAGMGVDLVGTSAAEVVKAWRAAHPKEVQLWYNLQRGVAALVSEGDGRLKQGRCEWYLDGPHLVCVLPSGREMRYRHARVERDGRITYDWAGGRRDTYGGKLTENVVSAIARDCLAEGIERLAGAAYQLCLHVHDEVVVSLTPDDDAALAESLFARVPSWAHGLPIAVESFVADRYQK